ncbi:hypothetical protein DLJ48_00560 [Oenococcus sicerae]|uniref:Uncharacterized protein n=1 Tax=Oenococcus sicerae TaxID=2203724 RepID=A0AAJ1RAN8_9LACO|nr:hypothetical protein [Oenococcus sicerae]MDN6900842.1 hypothetical protein [Oenococcus sicerae]QAS69119.1 hypothetical protein DLJ48_00560 [Oenococcus sicerae]
MSRKKSFVLVETLIALSIATLAIFFLLDLQSQQRQQITRLKIQINRQRTQLETKFYAQK